MTNKGKLRNALRKVYLKLIAHEKNIKVWESEYQKAINTVFPNECWWNVTGCDVFIHLLQHKDPELTMMQIILDYKIKEDIKMENEKALVKVSGGALMESEVITEALAFAQKGFGGMPVTLPQGYDVSRAVKNLCFALPNVKNIENATKESIMQAMHDYITQGLDVGKHQAALIVYGDRLTVQREYFGNIKIAMNLNPNIAEISHGTVIYAGEKMAVSYDKFGRTNVKHEPDFSCWNSEKIVGAYVIVTYKDGTTDTELMTMTEIKAAWAQSRNGDKVHKAFPAEMCKKTVLNRLCKKLVNSTDDSALIDDIDERQNIEPEPVDIDAIQEYSEPKETAESEQENLPELKPVSAPPVDEPPAPVGNPEDENYCITVHFSIYKNDYADCKTGKYNRGTKMIEVYPNRKKDEKKAETGVEEGLAE